MATSGQKPGSGVYICNKCGKVVRVDERSESLPSCPKCKGTEFTP